MDSAKVVPDPVAPPMGDSAVHPPEEHHRRPDGVDDATVAGVGKLSEAVEWIERARGRLFDFHQLIGRADLLLEEAADLLDCAGHHDAADRLRTDIIGRNVLDGRWTFQMVEEFDELYYGPVRSTEDRICAELVEGRRHVFEAELKERRRTRRRPGHEGRPPTSTDGAGLRSPVLPPDAAVAHAPKPGSG